MENQNIKKLVSINKIIKTETENLENMDIIKVIIEWNLNILGFLLPLKRDIEVMVVKCNG